MRPIKAWRTGLAVLLAATAGCRSAPPREGVPATAHVAVTVAGAYADQMRGVTGILHERLRALGVLPTDERTAGEVVTFGLPRALTSEERETLARPGRLAFRLVLRALPAGDCVTVEGRERIAAKYGGAAQEGEQMTSCDLDGKASYLLGPAELTGRDVKSAEPGRDDPGVTADWVVRIEFRDADRWLDFTGRHVAEQLAIVLDGTTQSAPTIQESIPDGVAQISGSFTEDQAVGLAAVIRYGALPRPVVVTPV
jgi:preprotein translocase subunit SecD